MRECLQRIVEALDDAAYRTSGGGDHHRLARLGLAHVEASDGVIPWQRMINAQRKIAIPKDSPGHRTQIRLLKAEGVVFLKGKVSFEHHGWQPW